MSENSVYCIDTSSLIAAWSRLYPRQIFPSLWAKLEDLIAEGRLRASEEVLRELKRKEDDLHIWAKGQTNLFVPFDEPQSVKVSEILKDFSLLVDSTRNRSAADPFVIALAALNKWIVVSEERGGSDKKPKIPTVCRHYKLVVISLTDMIIREGWSF